MYAEPEIGGRSPAIYSYACLVSETTNTRCTGLDAVIAVYPSLAENVGEYLF